MSAPAKVNLREVFLDELKKLGGVPPERFRVSFPPRSRTSLFLHYGNAAYPTASSVYASSYGLTQDQLARKLADTYVKHEASVARARLERVENAKAGARRQQEYEEEQLTALAKLDLYKMPKQVTVRDHTGMALFTLRVEGFNTATGRVDLFTQTEVLLSKLLNITGASLTLESE